jgi:hypothetical protein
MYLPSKDADIFINAFFSMNKNDGESVWTESMNFERVMRALLHNYWATSIIVGRKVLYYVLGHVWNEITRCRGKCWHG